MNEADTRTEDMANRFELYTVEQTAKILGISRMTVYKLIGEKKLIAKKFGRAYIIQRKNIQKCLDENNKGDK